jgi:hypothetical protein
MISFSRQQGRRLRGVFRRHALGLNTRGIIPPLVFVAENTQLRVRHAHGPLAIEHVTEGSYGPEQSIALPFDALADLEGREDAPVALEAVGPETTVARWEDRGIPQTREYNITPLDRLPAFPEEPGAFAPMPTDLCAAVTDAALTCDDASTRYALSCVQLRGATRQIVATDGRQLLVQGGYAFPWQDDVLIRRAPLFACKELVHAESAAIGRTANHVVIRAGAWTVFLEIQKESRFPNVDHVLALEPSATARLRLDPTDAAFLAPALDRLPGGGEGHARATIDLNGRVAIRARGADGGPVTELVLSRSGYTGAPIQVSANRTFLARALRLGFAELCINDASLPLVSRAGERFYGWQPLDRDSVIPPGDGMITIESASFTPPPAQRPEHSTKVRTPVSDIARTSKCEPKAHTQPDGRTAEPKAAGSGLGAVIEDAETLCEALTAARTRARSLVMALRKHRKRERLVATTLASLKELRLQDVAS